MAVNNLSLSRIGTSSNLENGGTYDLLVVSTPGGFPSGQVEFKFETTPRKITGIQKVAQTFFRVLFTTKGSDVLHNNFGTQFPDLVIGANIQLDNQELMSAIVSCVKDAEAQTKSILNSSSADTASQLQSINIMGYNQAVDTVALYLKMITLAGEEATVAVPFPELDLPIANQ